MPDKLDLYQERKAEYAAKAAPQLLKIKPGKYLTVTGQGEPGGKEFTAKVGALYAVAYTLKFKKKFAGKDYKVCGLEGLWWGATAGDSFWHEPRETWQWKLIILTPNFITLRDLAQSIAECLKKAKPLEVGQVRLEKIGEGKCVQMLHVGPYSTENTTIERMHQFATEHGLDFHGLHHEIYLSDPRRVKPEKLRTILRMPVR